MQQFYYSYGCQMFCELERPDIIAKPDVRIELAASKYTLLIKQGNTRVVIKS